MAILKYRSLFADVLPRRSPKPTKYAPLGNPDNFVSVSASSSTSSLESITQPPAYAQAVGERSRKAVKVYPKPEADQVLSVTIRLRGDSYGEIFTTTATFQYVPLPPSNSLVLVYCLLILTVSPFKCLRWSPKPDSSLSIQKFRQRRNRHRNPTRQSHYGRLANIPTSIPWRLDIVLQCCLRP